MRAVLNPKGVVSLENGETGDRNRHASREDAVKKHMEKTVICLSPQGRPDTNPAPQPSERAHSAHSLVLDFYPP